MRLVFLILASVLTVAGIPFAASQDTRYETKVDIVGKSSLSTERLADALYARFALTLEAQPLKMAAKLCPGDPVYWYRLAGSFSYPFSGTGYLEATATSPSDSGLLAVQRKKEQRLLHRHRRLLETALRADLNYLPALYLYAVTKPTYDQRMQALARIASVDSDNAKPYYIMALLQYERLSRGKKWLVKEQAYQISQQQWDSVMNLIRKGNARTAFSATTRRLPSFADVKVSTDGQPWPPAAPEAIAQLMLNDLWIGGVSDAPQSFIFSARARQLVRQAAWQAKVVAKQGKRTEALDMLRTVDEFGNKMALSQPYRWTSLSIGMAMRSMVFSVEKTILSRPEDKTRREVAEKQARDWHKIAMEYLEHPIQNITDKSIKLAPSQYLQYPDFADEERQVAEAAKKLGLVK